MNNVKRSFLISILLILIAATAMTVGGCFFENKTKYVITFDKNYGDEDTVFATQDVFESSTAHVLNSLPERKGYRFTGWYKDKECNQEWRYSDIINSDIKVYAGWNIENYNIILHNFEEAEIYNFTMPDLYTVETEINLPSIENVFKDSNVLTGWYKDPGFKYPITKIERGNIGDINLYAKFETVFEVNNRVGFIEIKHEYKKYVKDMTVPAELDGSIICGITEFGFSEMPNLETVKILSTNENYYIHSYAFYECQKLNSIQLPEIWIILDAYAFANCSSLKEAYFDYVYTANYGVFENCVSLETVYLKNLATLYSGMFKNCISLKTVILGADMIYPHAFENCPSLTQSIIMVKEGLVLDHFSYHKSEDVLYPDDPDYIQKIKESEVWLYAVWRPIIYL